MDEAIKQEADRQEYEKQIAILSAQQDERSRISADMHDELGSGVTAIRLLSEIARQKTKEQPVDEISRISYNANELMTKMNAIIWSMNPGNDTVSSLVAYIRSYASEYLDNFDMDYNINVPAEIPNADVSGVKRRNIFLVLKESINNVMKHAKATLVEINIRFENEQMLVEIVDNGKGIDPEKLNQFGNGLKNMQRRMESIGGSFIILNNNGTTIKLEMPLH
jgi:signal transduction histidine kinase